MTTKTFDSRKEVDHINSPYKFAGRNTEIQWYSAQSPAVNQNIGIQIANSNGWLRSAIGEHNIIGQVENVEENPETHEITITANLDTDRINRIIDSSPLARIIKERNELKQELSKLYRQILNATDLKELQSQILKHIKVNDFEVML